VEPPVEGEVSNLPRPTEWLHVIVYRAILDVSEHPFTASSGCWIRNGGAAEPAAVPGR